MRPTTKIIILCFTKFRNLWTPFPFNPWRGSRSFARCRITEHTRRDLGSVTFSGLGKVPAQKIQLLLLLHTRMEVWHWEYLRQTSTRHNRFEGTHRLIDKFTATRCNTQTMPSRKSKCWKSSRLARQEKLTSLVACECVLHLARSHTLFQWDVIYKSSSGWLKLVPGLRTAMLVTPEGCCTR